MIVKYALESSDIKLNKAGKRMFITSLKYHTFSMLPNYISMDWDCYVSVDNEIEQLNSVRKR